jgi:hypothetical protein
MPSTYTTNGGIELPANGEQSGTWGETVNDNMSIIDRLTNGVGSISLSGTTHTLTTTDGTLSDGQYNVLVLGGSPSGTNTITISPNDGEHVYIVKNISGQTATFTQGSGASISVLNNTTKIIYADGAGAGAAVVDITGALDLGSLIIAGTSVTATAAELNYNDITTLGTVQASKTVTADASGDVLFPDGDKAIFGAGSDLQIYHDGSNSYISDQGAGNLTLGADGNINFLNAAFNEYTAQFISNGAVNLFYDNVAKLSTTSAGVTVTGAVSSNKGSAGTLATFTDGVNSNFVVETSSLLTTIGNGAGSAALAFKSNNTTNMTLDASGNVGIGTSSPAAKLEVASPASTPAVLRISSNKTGTGAGDRDRLDFYSADNSGTAYQLGYMDYDRADTTGTASYIAWASRVAGTVAERMRIDSSGNFLVGTTAQPIVGSIGKLGITSGGGGAAGTSVFVTDTNATAHLSKGNSDNSYYFGYFLNWGGSAVGSIFCTASATAYNTSSDYRLKTDAQPMVGASDRVLALKPVNFAWIVDGTRVDGFLAHEAQAVVPECVTGTKDAVDADGKPEYQGIDQSKLVPLLTAALQEALTKIAALEDRVAALEG